MLNIPVSFTIAQAALESAWGESKLTLQANNLFGIKADKSWTGKTVMMPTREFVNKQWITINSLWRSYNNWTESILDHSKFIHDNPRYRFCFISKLDGLAFAKAIQAAGYATDPDYSNKIISIINSNNLLELDTK